MRNVHFSALICGKQRVLVRARGTARTHTMVVVVAQPKIGRLESPLGEIGKREHSGQGVCRKSH